MASVIPIAIQPAPVLLVGLGARILLDLFNRNGETSIKDHVLLGVWEGVALHYSFKNFNLGLLLLIPIAGKLFIDFNQYPDLPRCAITLLGIALGFLGTDLMTQFVDSKPLRPSTSPDRRRRKTSHSTPTPHVPKRQRLVQFEPIPKYRPVSDITSIDSNSDLIRAQDNMTPLQREVAALRARASLADSERRRYREERRWAISEGNEDRAAQLKQQVKRYTSLMLSFHREADAKMLSGIQHPTQQPNGTTSSAQRSNTVPPTEHQPRVLRSSLSNSQPLPIASNLKQNSSRRGNAMPKTILRDTTR
ncbi:hypothetical protein AGABI1DRAFT_126744 [Agaricus bisporus var. burnettii JB137-S8]|uniref:Uncharacterized protein n=2 Tax=Agaricus bisporus var. burnettii TaxID=192524 RepID=K5XZ64_AGABU|nr:uncharacterized protein AGABI1DRAFT_126744 [Agaricus bisporus var. burnettii JB137-S8]EKM80695.1 hypothetical protein AGABI1DRAFT_126744 [Agaricus bisporus var. burnettii JB137-S8]KAF7782323.1 hypothetical protein Agabi119p4_1699 [Agaricus bisporus var. burnettii]